MITESYETIWLVIGLFTLAGIGSGFTLGYGLGLLRRQAAPRRR